VILPCQRVGFLVEGQLLDPSDRLHPANKDMMAKMIKSQKKISKSKLGKRKRNDFTQDHVMPNTTRTTPTQPRGSYAS
jgi:hypothetical protein